MTTFAQTPQNLLSNLIDEAPMPEAMLDQVKHRLTAWANSIPHHHIKDFGQQIKITQAKIVPFYHILLRTQYETRVFSRVQYLYKGGNIPACRTNESNINVWSYSWPSHRDFDNFEAKYNIEDSQQLINCATCAGRGNLKCPQCGGSGVLRCGTCKGSGRETRKRTVNKYQKCGCYGGTTNISSSGQRSGVCWQCNGAGWYMADVTEYFEIPCMNCAAAGRLPCGNCSATGAVGCQTCEGSGRIISLLMVTDTFTPTDDTTNYTLMDRSRFPIPEDPNRDFLYILNHDDIDKNSNAIFSTVPSAGLRSVLANICQKAKGRTLAERRILKQSLSIWCADIIVISYLYNKSDTYECYLIGSSMQVHAPINPFSKAVEKSLESVRLDLQNGHIDRGLEMIEKFSQMGVAITAVQQTYDGLRIALAKCYLHVAKSEPYSPDSIMFCDFGLELNPGDKDLNKHAKRILWLSFAISALPAVVFGLLPVLLVEPSKSRDLIPLLIWPVVFWFVFTRRVQDNLWLMIVGIIPPTMAGIAVFICWSFIENSGFRTISAIILECVLMGVGILSVLFIPKNVLRIEPRDLSEPCKAIPIIRTQLKDHWGLLQEKFNKFAKHGFISDKPLQKPKSRAFGFQDAIIVAISVALIALWLWRAI